MNVGQILADRAAMDPFSLDYRTVERTTGRKPSFMGQIVHQGGQAIGLSRVGQQLFGPAGMGGFGSMTSLIPGMDTGDAPRMGGGGGRSGAMVSAPIYYDPRYATPDKLNFPRTEPHANSVWRHLYHHDPVISVCLDMMSEMPWSDFDLTGIDSGTPRRVFEDQMNDMNLLALLPEFSREFLITGKVIPHLVFDARKGHWVGCFAHNPDYVDVYPVAMWGYDPVLNLRPTPEMRMLALSPDPRLAEARDRMPLEVLEYVMANIPLPLEPVNVAYIARKANPYATIGVSILTRIFGTQMLQDVLASATIAVGQRNAAPLRLFKLGDAAGGYIPTKEDQEQLAALLSIVETDPFSALIFHAGLEVDYIGVSDKLMSVSREWDYLERVKLLALGVSKSFLLGETSYASAVAGMQVFVERLQTFRRMFEQRWIIPKLFTTIAKMNGFYRRVPSRVHNRILVPDDRRELEIPKIQWHKRLHPMQDPATLNIQMQLNEIGKFSDRSLVTGAGGDFDAEMLQRFEDAKKLKELSEDPEYADLIRGGWIPGMGPAAMMEDQGGGPGPGSPIPGNPMRRASRMRRRGRAKTPYRHRTPTESSLSSVIWDRSGYHHGIHYEEAEPIIELLRTGSTEDEQWNALSGSDPVSWDEMEAALADSGWRDDEIWAMRRIAGAELRGGQSSARSAKRLRQRFDAIEAELERGGSLAQRAGLRRLPSFMDVGPGGRNILSGSADAC